jgi:hypothetical protein
MFKHREDVSLARGPGQNGMLRRWLRETGAMASPGSDPREDTHMLFDGGRIRLPSAAEDEFVARYAEALAAGEWLYVVERRSQPRFRMFFEVDYVASQPLDASSIAVIVHTLDAVVHERAGPSAAVAAVAPPASPAAASVKSGIHVVWPATAVTDAEALAMRDECAKRLAATSEIAAPTNGWDEELDACVFGPNGMRMIGSRKAAACASCRDEQCAACGGTRHIDLGRPYALFGVFGDAAAALLETQLRRSALALVRATSIRIGGSSGNTNTITRSTNTRATVAARPAAVPPAGLSAFRGAFTDTDDPTLTECVRRRVLRDPYGATLKRLRRSRDGHTYVVSTRSRLCANKGSEHTSATVYFVITSAGASQRCFSRHVFGGVPCLGFRGPVEPLASDAAATLFGTAMPSGLPLPPSHPSLAVVSAPAQCPAPAPAPSPNCCKKRRVMPTMGDSECGGGVQLFDQSILLIK